MNYRQMAIKVLAKFNADLYAHYAKSILIVKDRYYHYFNNLNEEKIDDNVYLFESKHGQTFEGHIFYLLKKLREENKDAVIYLTCDKKEKKFKQLLQDYQIENINILKFKSVEYYRILATAKYLINDTTFIKRFVKRKEQIYINTWHGTPLKYLGKNLEDKLALHNVQKNFFVSDYILHTNEYTSNIMKNAFQLNDIYKGHNVIGPSIRNSVLFDEKRRDTLRDKLKLQDKKVVVYLPTYRGNYNEGKNAKRIVADLKLIDEKLSEDVVFYIKLHPLDANINFKKFKNIRPIPNEYELYDFLTCSDMLVSDYSSIMYDYLNVDKEIVLYLYDKEEYFEERGVYENIDEYNFTKIKDINTLITKINEIKSDYFMEYPKEKAKFAYLDNAQGSQEIFDFLFKNKKNDKITDENLLNDKKTIAFYVGDLRDNGITSAFLNTLNSIDVEAYNIIVIFANTRNARRGIFKLAKFFDHITYYPVSNYMLGNHESKKAERRYVFSKLEENLEIDESIVQMINYYSDSLFGNIKIDYFVHFTGYEITFSLLTAHSKADYRRVMYVHSDMPEEFKNRPLISSRAIVDAFKNADDIVLVNDKLENNLAENFPFVKDRINVIQNFFGDQEVRDRAQEDLEEALEKIEVKNFGGKTKEDMIADLKNEKVKTLIAVGRMDQVKGFDRLIKAYNTVMKNDSHYRLIIVTINHVGEIFQQMTNEINSGKGKDNIYLVPRMDNPFPLLNACDCFVLSSKYEGTGLVLFEALALDKQVITTNLEIFDDILDDEQAIIVDNSTEGLVEGLRRYKNGEVSPKKFDFELNKQRSIDQFNDVFKK